jgi:transglutaminase-like putative cysteine protease
MDTRPWWAVNTQQTIFDQLFNFAVTNYNVEDKGVQEIFDPGYINIYLQYPNQQLQRLADKITYGLHDNDDKATAIIRWVLHNFPYETDENNYGYDELWVPPTFSLAKGSGDCEDGAFLVHSLLLHAGVDHRRIRTYGGFVDAGEGAASGGHAWTAYRRERDDEWVVLDSSYYPNLKHVEERPLMRETAMYRENFFYFNRFVWTNLEGVDRIHNPGAWYNYNQHGQINQQLRTAGIFISRYA